MEPLSVTARSDNSRWRWMALVANFFSLMLNASTSYHVGVLNIALLDTYGNDIFTTSWLLSIYGSLYALAAPLGSAVINLTNCRTCVILSGVLGLVGFIASSFVTRLEWLFLTITVAGIGQSLSQVGGIVALAFNFPDMVSIATSICLTGTGLGSFLHPVLLQTLIDSYNLKGAFLVLGGLALHSCVAGLMLRPTIHETQKLQEDKPTENSIKARLCDCVSRVDIGVLINAAFAVQVLSVFTFSVAFQTANLYLPEYLITITGLSKQEASVAASMVGAGSILSRFFVGFVASDPKVGEMLMFIGMNSVSFLFCLVAKLLLQSSSGAYLFSFALGAYANSTQPLFNPITFQILGYKRGTSGCGIILLASGLGNLLGPPLTARLVESLGFDILFYSSGFLFLLTSALGVVTCLLNQSQGHASPQNDSSPNRHTAPADVADTDFEIILPENSDVTTLEEARPMISAGSPQSKYNM